MSEKLYGKTALITGASEGVGRAIAETLGRHKMHLGLISRSRDKLEQVAENVTKAGSKALVLDADLRNPSDIKAAAKKFKEEFGFSDFLINNAGIGFRGFWVDVPLESELDIMAVNYTAPLILIRTLLPDMLQADTGHVININSIGGLYAAPYQGAYCASKWSLLAYSESLAYELKNTKVNISSIFPGPIDTNFSNHPNYESFKNSPDMVSSDEVAKVVLDAINNPRERVLFGPLWPLKLLVVKIAGLYPQLFRKLIEKKNTPPKKINIWNETF